MVLEPRDRKLIRQANLSFLAISVLAIFSLGLYLNLEQRSAATTVLGTSVSPTDFPSPTLATPSSVLK